MPSRCIPEHPYKPGTHGALQDAFLHILVESFGDVRGAGTAQAGAAADEPWPELAPALLQALAAPEPPVAALEAAAALVPALAAREQWVVFSAQCGPVLASACARASSKIRPRCARALGALLEAVPESALEGDAAGVGGVGVVDAYVAAELSAPLRDGDEDALREGLGRLVELAEERPRLFRDRRNVATDALRLWTDGPCRALAVELVVALAEGAPATWRKAEIEGRPFAAAAADACLELLLRDDDGADPSEWEVAGAAPPDEPQDCGRELGQESLDRLCRALGPASFLPRALEVVSILLRDAAQDPVPRWRRARAGCDALAQLAEHVGDLTNCPTKSRAAVPLLCSTGKASMKQRRRDFVGALLPFATRYPAGVVRAAAWDALGQACADLGPRIQDECASSLLPALCASAERDAAPRARAAACRASLCFLDCCTFSTLEPYLGDAVRALASAMADGVSNHVREHAVAAAAALAVSCSTCSDAAKRAAVCRELYGVVAGPLRPLAAGAHYASNKGDLRAAAALRARALLCLAITGSEAGRDVFGDDARALLDIVTRDYFDEARRRPEDDAERAGALKSVVRVATCLGADFAPFLDRVVAPLLQAARGDRILVERSADDSEDDDGDDLQPGEFVVRTEALEEQAQACQLVCALAEATMGGYAPYRSPSGRDDARFGRR